MKLVLLNSSNKELGLGMSTYQTVQISLDSHTCKIAFFIVERTISVSTSLNKFFDFTSVVFCVAFVAGYPIDNL
ncbi:hypothetical protein KUTeg_015482 [Tegillarca granosa]|uniref:Uncharacterized protein n=1 Tax=Tegillarca granosa TaxID=220873 RepID=A0ABQ9EQA6_TEGGR|nr:hypothetical protein KUTeg_015482 [Tegillarca granosa]